MNVKKCEAKVCFGRDVATSVGGPPEAGHDEITKIVVNLTAVQQCGNDNYRVA
jgi:hypothetical protein